MIPVTSSDVSSNAEVVFLFSFPTEEQKEQLLKWLSADEAHLAVLVEEREEQFLALSFLFAGHLQVRLLFLRQIGEEDLKQVCWEACLKRAAFIFAADCSEERRLVGADFFATLAHYQRGIDLLASDYSDLGMQIASNTFGNLKYLTKAKNGLSLQNAFQNVPAIICGAGASLTAQLENLPEAMKCALVFAGGSAMQVFSAAGIFPHFISSIDPDPPYERFAAINSFAAPFFYQSRLSGQLLPLVQGELIWLPDNGGWGWEKAILQEAGVFEGGWTVATFCTAVASHLGCNPIIFLGMDLAFREERYAAGVTHAIEEELVVVNGAEGEQLFSKRDWILSAEWLSEFARQHPGMAFWNASTGGLPISGVKNFSFIEVMQELTNFADLGGLVHAQLQKAQPASYATAEELQEKSQRVVEGIVRIEGMCDALLEICERLHPQPPFESGQYVLLEMDLEEDEIYQKVFLPIRQVWQHLLRRSSPYPIADHLNRWLFLKRICRALRNSIE